MSSILGFGANYFGQLGIGSSGSGVPNHSAIEFGGNECINLNDASCGSQFSIILQKNGSIWFCGALNGTIFPLLTHVEVSYPLKCKQIACGKKHILALMESGFVLSWGFGYFGQLGHGDDSSWDQPRMVHSLKPAELGTTPTIVVCGAYHSAVITSDKRAFMWGLNRSGQCGIGEKADTVTQPRPVAFKSGVRISMLACGRNHSLALHENGSVWAWGASGFGRLGIQETPKNVHKPMEIVQLRSTMCRFLACGDFHSLAVTRDSTVYSWGQGGDGQLGHGNLYNMRTPQVIEDLVGIEVISVSCGSCWSTAVSKEGLLYCWGNADGGWLGSSPRPRLPFLDCDSDNLPLTCMDSEVQSFDSKLNILVPSVIRSISTSIVSHVRCGGGHTLVIIRGNRVADDRTFVTSKQSGNQLLLWSRHGELSTIKEFLLSHGNVSDVINFRDGEGNTPLIIAAKTGRMDVVRLLIRHGANINAVDNKSNSALHYSFAYQFNDIGRYLIHEGADEYLLNIEGLTCYEGLTAADLDNF